MAATANVGHWTVAAGDSWATVARAAKVDKVALAAANGAHLDPDGVIRPPLATGDVGRVIHVPFPGG